MDGTLVDSSACVSAKWRTWAVARGLDPHAVLALSEGRRNEDTVALAAPHLDAAERDRESRALMRAEERTVTGLAAVAGARTFLTGLDPDRWAVVTSAWRRLVEVRMAATGLPLPPVVVTADDVAEGKPSPDGYLLAARRLDVPAGRCLVAEDSTVGIAAARAAGMTVLAVAAGPGGRRPPADLVVEDWRAVSWTADDAGPG